MHLLWFLPWFLLVEVARADVDSSYQFSSGWRPNNITGLDYEIYSHTGSYYNGTLTFAFHLVDPNINDSVSGVSFGDASVNPCAAYINNTIEVTLNAVAGITMPSQGTLAIGSIPYANFTDESNPLRIDIWGWADGGNLANFNYSLDERTANYPYVSFFTQGREVFLWDIALGASLPSQYSFLSLPSNFTSQFLLGFSLNLTQACSNSTVDTADADKYLYEGGLLAPFNGNQSMVDGYTWTDSIPYPSMTGHFDDATAHIDVTGLFSLDILWGDIVGSANITFSGSLDAGRSDHLLLGEAKPEWNATLGFSAKNVSSNAASSENSTRLEGKLWVYLGLVLLCIL